MMEVYAAPEAPVVNVSGQTIEYRLKFWDYFLFNVAHCVVSPLSQLINVGGAFVVSANAFPDHPASPPAITLFILCYLGAWLLQCGVIALYISLGRNRSLFTTYKMRIQDDALVVETPFAHTRYFWSGIPKVVSRPGFLAVYLNAVAAQIVPARAFGSDEHRRNFYLSLEQKRKSG